ncbi:MAG: uroporphyrinogen-III synthase [Neisseria sp.]|nr:uroporphyrinogen-III synthase [Neisseria sp.]
MKAIAADDKPCIFIVRPESKTVQDCRRFEQAGWRAVPFSPLKLQENFAALAVLAEQLSQYQVAFWVSPSAVEIAFSVLQNHDFKDDLLHIAVGEATKAALEKQGVKNVLSPSDGKDSEAVLRLSVWQDLPKQSKILIVRGENGRDFLASRLHEMDFVVDYADVYRRVPQNLDWSVLQTASPVAAYITSAQMVCLLFEQVPTQFRQNLQSLLYLTHHSRIVAALYEAGATRVHLVDNANPAAWQQS